MMRIKLELQENHALEEENDEGLESEFKHQMFQISLFLQEKLLLQTTGDFSDLRYLYQQLSISLHIEPEFSRFSELEKQPVELEGFLNAILGKSEFKPDLLLTSSVSDANLPFPLQIRFALMNEKINSLSNAVFGYEDKIRSLQSSILDIQNNLKMLVESKAAATPAEVVTPYTPSEPQSYVMDVKEQSFEVPNPDSQPVSAKVPPISLEDDPNFEQEYALCGAFEKEAEEIIRLVQPRENQFEYRSSATNYLKKQITRSLNCPVLDLSFHELKCFLPDDPIKITVVLSQSSISTWHKVVYDRLLIISEQDARSEVDSELEEEEEKHVHSIKTIRLVNESSIFKVIGMIDSIPFEVVANARVDLCMLAFFEEVNSLVGRDHLMKRSMLLIRSWWLYETGNISEKSPKEFLPDFAIWLMVTSIFNKYHNRITSPIQALYLFFYMFGVFDGNVQAITLQGIRSFTDYSSNLVMWDENQDLLIPPKLYEKYFQVVNIHNSSPIDKFGPRNVKVDRCGYTVVHPFNYTSLTLEKLSNRKSEKISSCFKTAMTSLSQLFQAQAKPSPSTAHLKSLMRAVFPETLKKIGGQNWRIDTFSSPQFGQMESFDLEMLRSPRDVFTVHIEQIWHNILYCNFLIEAVVSESALLSLCTEVLMERKILPVGEVGKTLSDVTAIANLSAQLREKFGGLKKFLERYPEIFVISKDHPFNPNVVLRKSLTSEQFDMFEKKGVPLQTFFKQAAPAQKQPVIPQGGINISSAVLPPQAQPQLQQPLPQQKKVTRQAEPVSTLAPDFTLKIPTTINNVSMNNPSGLTDEQKRNLFNSDGRKSSWAEVTPTPPGLGAQSLGSQSLGGPPANQPSDFSQFNGGNWIHNPKPEQDRFPMQSDYGGLTIQAPTDNWGNNAPGRNMPPGSRDFGRQMNEGRGQSEMRLNDLRGNYNLGSGMGSNIPGMDRVQGNPMDRLNPGPIGIDRYEWNNKSEPRNWGNLSNPRQSNLPQNQGGYLGGGGGGQNQWESQPRYGGGGGGGYEESNSYFSGRQSPSSFLSQQQSQAQPSGQLGSQHAYLQNQSFQMKGSSGLQNSGLYGDGYGMQQQQQQQQQQPKFNPNNPSSNFAPQPGGGFPKYSEW